GALVHPAVLDRDDQRALGSRLPHPAVGVEPAVRSDVRRDRRGRGARLRERSAPAPDPSPRARVAGGRAVSAWRPGAASVFRRVALLALGVILWEAAARSGRWSPLIVP